MGGITKNHVSDLSLFPRYKLEINVLHNILISETPSV